MRSRIQGEPLTGSRLKERALDLLSRRDHSELELKRKLREKGGLESEIQQLLDELRGKGYLDDLRFGQNFVRYRSGKIWGRKRFRQELLMRGVASELVDTILSEATELRQPAVLEKLGGFLEKQLGRGKPREKVFASLARRGFSLGLVREAYDRLIEAGRLESSC